MSSRAPKYALELQAWLDANPEVSRTSLRQEDIGQLRETFVGNSIHSIIAGRNLESYELTVPGYLGAELTLTVIQPRGVASLRPLIFNIHSGGMIAGDRFIGLETIAQWADDFQVAATSIEYRLAPEFPDPYPIEDCYRALIYVAENASELGIDPKKIVVTGLSAGGGLSAGVALLARDRDGPELAGQMLICPMLDERNDSRSGRQFVDIGLWDRGSNDVGWSALLGDRRHTPLVSIYASPAMNVDYSGLPPTFLDVGSHEIFRSEVLQYAESIWLAGGDCELHVWAGAFHGFDLAAPGAEISKRAVSARGEWLRRVLDL
ncbi:MAG: alpha/beta hydrolase [Aquiluna sp.]|nr:alpha/beta hydrolase [Aquiluna sp.]